MQTLCKAFPQIKTRAQWRLPCQLIILIQRVTPDALLRVSDGDLEDDLSVGRGPWRHCRPAAASAGEERGGSFLVPSSSSSSSWAWLRSLTTWSASWQTQGDSARMKVYRPSGSSVIITQQYPRQGMTIKAIMQLASWPGSLATIWSPREKSQEQEQER